MDGWMEGWMHMSFGGISYNNQNCEKKKQQGLKKEEFIKKARQTDRQTNTNLYENVRFFCLKVI